jgi:ABC-2 type transport system ATP-binding protein
MIEARELTKRYGDTAVDSLSFTIARAPPPSTASPYRQHRAPLREVGALLEASAVHPGRSAHSHLRSMAATHNIKASRVSEVSTRPDLPPHRRTDRSSRKKNR